jgi:hypothetical protein
MSFVIQHTFEHDFVFVQLVQSRVDARDLKRDILCRLISIYGLPVLALGK